jgi:DNA-binding NarL/FixJ family response regulator
MSEISAAPPIRVLVVDDQQLIQDGISTILNYQPGIAVVGVADNGQSAIEQALRLQPDVILMDVRMPVMDGVAATAHLRQELPASRILMLTTFDDEDYVLQALRAGASGYLLKNIPGRELAQAVRAVHAGVYQLDPAVANRVIELLSKPPQPTTTPPPTPMTAKLDLTEREIEILRCLAAGATNREIAEQLVITEGTVKNHVSNILSRLGLRDRTQAALFAREQGLVPDTFRNQDNDRKN